MRRAAWKALLTAVLATVTLSRGEVYLPLLLKDENGLEHGNDWARGFVRGTRLRFDGWAELLTIKTRADACIAPDHHAVYICLTNVLEYGLKCREVSVNIADSSDSHSGKL
jgi:hypothetical protein